MFGTVLFFILFEFAFFSLVGRLGDYFYEMWIIEAIIVVIFTINLYSSLSSSKSKVMKLIKTGITLLLLLLFLAIFVFVCVLFPALIVTKIIFLSIVVYYVINLACTIRFTTKNMISMKRIKVLGLISIIACPYILMGSAILFVPNIITIKPDSQPELVFWCASNELPKDNETLENCEKYNIAFITTISTNQIRSQTYMDIYKNVINHKINLYFCVGGDSQFYCNVKTAGDFDDKYDRIREWFIEENILSSPYIKAFCVDAEPPKAYEENTDKADPGNTASYGVDNYPSKQEREEVFKAMKSYVEKVQDDGKLCGIIKPAEMLDSADGDGDMSFLRGNIHSLDLPWDFSITMLYRTNPWQGDESEQEEASFTVAGYSMFMGTTIEGTKMTNSELSFYQNVALLKKTGDTNAKDRYIFVGNFKKEYEDTEYIKKEQYKKDLDICRHFGAEKVFFYELKGFVRHYGWEAVFELALYNQRDDQWTLEYNNFKSIVFLFFYLCLIIVDVFAALEVSFS